MNDVQQSPDRSDLEQQREMAATMAALKVLQAQHPTGPSGPDLMGEAAKRLPGKGELIKQAPAVAMICGTVIFLGVLVVFSVLVVVGKPTDELFRLMNLFLNATGAIGVLATLTVAISHARRIRENKAETLANRQATFAVGVEVHEAAEAAGQAARASGQAARAVNGDLEQRMQRVLRPMIEDAVTKAVTKAMRAAGEGGSDAVRG